MPNREQLKVVNLDAVWRRALLILPAALALYGAWTVARWCLGNALASNTQDIELVLAAARTRPNDPAVREALKEISKILHAAESYAPDDPQVHFTLGAFARKTFEPEELRAALARYEHATALSPHDYRLWMDLGRARGQAGDTEGGERALRHAVSLAPHYSMPRWHLGNHLMRAGREREAFAELRRAAEIDPKLHTQIFTAAWSYFGGDLRAVADAVGDSAEARARLVEYLITQKRLDDATAVWATLRADDRRSQGTAGKNLTAALVAAGRMRRALEVFRDYTGGGQEVAVGQLVNGGFESDIGGAAASPFDWNIRTVPQAQMGLDKRIAHAGRSLRITFSAPNAFAFGQFSQLVLVEPQTRYRLSYFLRTEEMKGASTVLVEILGGGQRIAAGSPVAPGTAEWREEIIEFTSPAQGEAIELRVVRAPCAEQPCPVFGKVWYDDFNLQRATGAADARAAATPKAN